VGGGSSAGGVSAGGSSAGGSSAGGSSAGGASAGGASAGLSGGGDSPGVGFTVDVVAPELSVQVEAENAIVSGELIVVTLVPPVGSMGGMTDKIVLPADMI
jgi:hypothetical protein